MHTIDHLYRSYDPEEEHAFVFNHRYTDDVEVALRPFSNQKDLSTFNKWINEELHVGNRKLHTPSHVDGSYFRTILRIPNAQSLFGLINDQPSFQVDLFKATDYHVPFYKKGLTLTDGDVHLQLIISSVFLNSSLAEWILPACIDHCFTHTGVQRVILLSDAQDTQYCRLAEKASPISHYKIRNNRSVYFYGSISSTFKKNIELTSSQQEK